MRPDRVLPADIAARTDGHAHVLDVASAQRAFGFVEDALAGCDSRIWYAVKCNPSPELLEGLRRAGCGFEAASVAELELVASLGVDLVDVPYTNPIRSSRDTAAALTLGVRMLTVDSVGEVDRVIAAAVSAGVAPSTIITTVRIATPGEHAVWDLSGKFGAAGQEAIDTARHALSLGLDVAGVSFHVGSQAHAAQAWVDGLVRAAAFAGAVRGMGGRIRIVDVGGGYPVSYENPDQSADAHAIARILSCVREHLDASPELAGATLAVEPGRFLAAPAGRYVATVIGTVERPDGRWVYTTVGTYNGPSEPRDSALLTYPIVTERTGPLVPTTVAGPTCDAADVLARGVMLPDLADGDTIEILYAGAYSSTIATAFNGFALPPTIVVDSVDDAAALTRQSVGTRVSSQ